MFHGLTEIAENFVKYVNFCVDFRYINNFWINDCLEEHKTSFLIALCEVTPFGGGLHYKPSKNLGIGC